jgi:hypothetical protein
MRHEVGGTCYDGVSYVLFWFGLVWFCLVFFLRFIRVMIRQVIASEFVLYCYCFCCCCCCSMEFGLLGLVGLVGWLVITRRDGLVSSVMQKDRTANRNMKALWPELMGGSE